MPASIIYTSFQGDGGIKREWRIIRTNPDMEHKDFCHDYQDVLFSRPYTEDDDDDEHGYPADVREEYERVIGRPEFIEVDEDKVFCAESLVELVADREDCAFDQPCAYGYRVDSHAVYCHNNGWLYAPSKCRRGRGEEGEKGSHGRHENCPGFKAREGKGG